MVANDRTSAARAAISAAIVVCALAVAVSGVARAQPEMRAWSTYTSEAAGYAIDHPPDWTVDERVDESGLMTVTFAPPEGLVAFEVTALTPLETDLTKLLCRPAYLRDLPVRLCHRMDSSEPIAIVFATDRVYVITSSDSGRHRVFYDQLVGTFRLLDPQAPASTEESAATEQPPGPESQPGYSRFADGEPSQVPIQPAAPGRKQPWPLARAGG